MITYLHYEFKNVDSKATQDLSAYEERESVQIPAHLTTHSAKN